MGDFGAVCGVLILWETFGIKGSGSCPTLLGSELIISKTSRSR